MVTSRYRVRLGASALVLSMLTAGPALAAPHVAAEQPWSIASPTSDLAAVAEVTVAWNGDGEDAYYYFRQCVADGPADQCQTVYFTASLEGAGSELSFSVARFLQTAIDVIDCAEVDCVLQVVAGYGGDLALVEPLHFDPATERPLPAVQLTPATGLVHGAGVTVEVDIPVGYRQPTLLQCHRDDLSAEACRELLAPMVDSLSLLRWSGGQAVHVVQALQLRQAFQSPSGDLVGCGVDECVLVIASSHERLSLTPLVFASPPAFELEVTMEVRPTADLVDGQVVDVAVSAPAGWYRIEQCFLGDQPHCMNRTRNVQPPPLGAINVPIEVDRIVRDAFSSFDQSVSADCAEVNCVLRIWPLGWGDVAPAAVVSLSFDPDAPFRPAPQLSLSPAGPVYEGQTVTVSGAGYEPNSLAAVGLCPGPNPSGLTVFDVWAAAHVCGVLDFVSTDGSGQFSTDVELYTRGRGALGGEAFDCTVEPCWIGASTFSLRGGFTGDLVFVSEALATADPRVRDLLLDVTTSHVVDEIHMAEEKAPEPPPTPRERLDALAPQASVPPDALPKAAPGGKTSAGDG